MKGANRFDLSSESLFGSFYRFFPSLVPLWVRGAFKDIVVRLKALLNKGRLLFERNSVVRESFCLF